MDENISSLSAILLDDNYYEFLKQGKVTVDGVTVLDAAYLIPFKAKAWMDLTDRKAAGEHVDSKNIKKHIYFEFGSLEDHFKYRQAVKEAYSCGHYPVFEGYDHMQYQVRDPKSFAEMLAYIAEHDGMPKLSFIRK